MRCRLAHGLEFRVVAGCANAEFRRFVAPAPDLAGPALHLDGKTINFVPEFALDAR